MTNPTTGGRLRFPRPGTAIASASLAAALAAAPAAEPGPVGDAWSDARNPIAVLFGGERLDLWSLRPVDPPTPPEVAGALDARVANPIDRFVFAKLADAGLAPAPEADRRTLIRRVTFDLTGLPPTPAEVDAFLADDAPGAWERVVDRLLASPRFGEHAARRWLDVVRYSDSNGFDWDEFRPEAWRFRDYVIRSLQADKPIDRFVVEQLAGDELVAGAPRDEAERDALIATGYLRIGPQDNSAALFNEQARGRAEWLFDLVETTGSAFLGLTFSCCRCHDHKFDPLSQADYFRMRAFFEGVAHADDRPLELAHERDALEAHNAAVEEKTTPLRDERDRLLAAARARLEAAAPDAAGAADRDDASPSVSDDAVRGALTDDESARLAALDTRLAELEASRRTPTTGLLATDAPGEPPVTRILPQGDHRHEGEAVACGIPSVLDPGPAEILRAPNPDTTGRRLALARWIVSPENPFTSRVFVNRAWQAHFGTGLVATPDDFGRAGAPPSHPGLLDWLADAFVADGWSAKRLHRLIVTSATYRQASSPDAAAMARGCAADPSNSLLWRQSPRRLTAEQLRDALLAVSGRLLDEHPGGPPVWPELPPEVLQANPAFLDDNAEKTKGWYPSPPDARDVRSIFLVQKRTVRVPFLETFDLPDNSTSCARRTESIVAPQALALLNGATAVACARSLAERVDRTAGTGADAPALVRAAFRLALQREPLPDEEAAAVGFLGNRRLDELARALVNTNEFFFID